MEQYPLNESLWRRGWNDTKAIWTGWKFYVFDAVGAGLIAERFGFGWYWGSVVAILGMVGAWICATARASVKQRDEARELVEQQRKPSDSEVVEAIGLLEAETLVLRHNSGEERLYSFAQVLLAIADQLTIGVSLIHFESPIIKGLSIDERGGWYFPYDDDGITHLIGILAQNALIERHNEEYQHMTREVVSGEAGIYLTPDAHLVKNTEVKYYLSSLGARVVKQLRQQSTAGKEGSQT